MSQRATLAPMFESLKTSFYQCQSVDGDFVGIDYNDAGMVRMILRYITVLVKLRLWECKQTGKHEQLCQTARRATASIKNKSWISTVSRLLTKQTIKVFRFELNLNFLSRQASLEDFNMIGSEKMGCAASDPSEISSSSAEDTNVLSPLRDCMYGDRHHNQDPHEDNPQRLVKEI